MSQEGGPTLRRVLAALGEAALTVVAAPRGLDVPAGEPVVYDPLDDDRLGPDLVVLGAGCEGAAAEELVALAGRDGASAVVLKVRPRSAPPAEAATAAGVALLTVPAVFAWGQLLSLLRAAVDGDAAPEAMEGDDLFGLANALADALGGPVTVEDRHSRVLAYSTLDQPVDEGRRLTILGRQVPEHYLQRLRDDGVLPRLWSSVDPIRVDGLGDLAIQPRLAVALRAGGEVLGSIWVAQGERPLDAQAERLLADAAPLASLQLVRQRARRDFAAHRREQALAALLAGEDAALAPAALDLAPDAPLLVAAVEPDARPEGVDAEVTRVRLNGLADLSCAWWRAGAVRGWVDGRLYLLLPVAEDLRRRSEGDAGGQDGGRPEERALRLGEELAERARAALGVVVRVGVGSLGQGAAHAAVSRVEADRVVRVLRERPGGAVVAAYAAVRARAQLAQLADLVASRPELRAGRLADLVRHDAVHGSEYVATVRAYLMAFGDVPLAAEALAVHPNTFRYRLRRLAEVSGLHLVDHAERLVMELQLLVLEQES